MASYAAVLLGRWKEAARALQDLDSHGTLFLLYRATFTTSPGNSSHARARGTHFKWLHWSGTIPKRASNLGNSLHQWSCAILRYGEREKKNIQRPQELQFVPLFWFPHREHFV